MNAGSPYPAPTANGNFPSEQDIKDAAWRNAERWAQYQHEVRDRQEAEWRHARDELDAAAQRARGRDTSTAITRAGGHTAWIHSALHGDLLHAIDYQDGPSPMTQIAFGSVA